MKELTLNEIKSDELEILKHFRQVCQENGIRFFLSNGTLLGAVKYKGFIPWDDDIDVFVPREDYDRLIRIYQDTPTYFLLSWERNHDYLFPFAKMCDMTTRKVEAIHSGVDTGLEIDIFPLDVWNDDLKKAKREVREIKRYTMQLGLTKLEKADSVNRVKRFIKAICMVWCKHFGAQVYMKKILSCVDNAEGSRYCGCKMWPIYGDREIIPAEVFSDTVEVEFEGEKFPAPVGYDAYLRSLYGDYWQDPPLSQQKTHHKFKAYRL